MLFPWEVRWNPHGNHQENSYRIDRKEIRKGFNPACKRFNWKEDRNAVTQGQKSCRAYRKQKAQGQTSVPSYQQLLYM